MSQTKALSIDEALKHKGSYIWVDVRSESEFSRAHIPGAINIPILNDEDRAEVGTTYKQKGRELRITFICISTEKKNEFTDSHHKAANNN